MEQSLTLPCGATLKNRIVKSAMSEQMAAPGVNRPDDQQVILYQRWSMGGTGLLISGNIMTSKSSLGTIFDVVIGRGHECLEELKCWAKAGTANNTHLWMQINHPGKQSPVFVNPINKPLAPSAIGFSRDFPLRKLFRTPRALTEKEIMAIIKEFSYTAKVAKEAGFTGVQIHGAHGYLVSQFLSPKHNQRSDQWGGSIENRMRFLVEIYYAMRRELGPEFPIGVKLNSSDFQKGGFPEEDSMKVIQQMSEIGMDLIEISGGTYEKTVMMDGVEMRESTRNREAYFLDYCEKVKTLNIKSPILLTGGFRSKEGMEKALSSGACDLIGIARPLTIDPDFSNKLLSTEKGKHNIMSPLQNVKIGWSLIDKALPIDLIWHTDQIRRLGNGLQPNPNLSPFLSLIWFAWDSCTGFFIQTLRSFGRIFYISDSKSKQY